MASGRAPVVLRERPAPQVLGRRRRSRCRLLPTRRSRGPRLSRLCRRRRRSESERPGSAWWAVPSPVERHPAAAERCSLRSANPGRTAVGPAAVGSSAGRQTAGLLPLGCWGYPTVERRSRCRFRSDRWQNCCFHWSRSWMSSLRYSTGRPSIWAQPVARHRRGYRYHQGLHCRGLTDRLRERRPAFRCGFVRLGQQFRLSAMPVLMARLFWAVWLVSVFCCVFVWVGPGLRVVAVPVLMGRLRPAVWLVSLAWLAFVWAGRGLQASLAEPPVRHRRMLEPNHREAQTVSRSLVVGPRLTGA